jgi:polysaccharide biosynthesis PFTS motif protein
MALLDEDIAYHALADVLNQQRLIENILITNSNASRQILWMSSLHNRYYKLHMAWYSQNGEFSYIYKWDPIQTSDIEYKYIVVDENWVWTKYFADNLSKIGTLGLFHSVGPILWYLPSIKKTLYENSIKVNIFDITPYSSNKLDRGGWKGAYNYGSYENLSNFIVDIIDIAKEYSEHKNKKVELLLKHKRSPGSLHDNNYIGLIDSFLESKELKIIHPYENMFNLISGSDLVIVLPYSSPAHVAHYLGVPAIFYDPSQDLIPFYDKSENVSFASGKKELMTTFFALLKEN